MGYRASVAGGNDLETTDPSVAEPGRPGWARFLGLAAAIVVVDQLTKAWLTSLLGPRESIAILGDYVRLVHGQNTGAIFGLFRDQAPLFALVSLLVVAGIVVYHGRARPSGYLSVTLGLLLGGAVGNLIDRFRLGHVVDWVDIGIGDVRFYTFNVADAAISTALLLLVASMVVPSLLHGRASLDRTP